MPKLDINLGEEMAKMHPLLLRKMAIKQMKVLGGDNIGITGMAILDILKEKDPCRMGKIAKVMGFTMSAATGAIDKMVEKDLVKRDRDKNDRRVVEVSILPKGKRVIKKIDTLRVNVANDVFAVFTEREKAEYIRLLRKAYDKLKGDQDA